MIKASQINRIYEAIGSDRRVQAGREITPDDFEPLIYLFVKIAKLMEGSK